MKTSIFLWAENLTIILTICINEKIILTKESDSELMDPYKIKE